MRKKRSINNRLDYREKEKYKRKKDIIYKEKKERKLMQKEVK
jgi:hypothetical protein